MFDWITGFIEGSGYIGIFLLMALENIFPPIPSELIMPLAGYTAAKGELNVVLVVVVGTAGSIVGALPWYYLGKLYGLQRLKGLAARHGRWLTVTPRDLDKANDWFDRHSEKAVFLGRLVPTVRTLISVPAGLASMHFPRFLLFTAAGTLIWTGILTVLGYILEDRYEDISTYLNPVSTAVVVGLVLAYLYRLIRHPHRVNAGR